MTYMFILKCALKLVEEIILCINNYIYIINNYIYIHMHINIVFH